jgi:hypothetical protein
MNIWWELDLFVIRMGELYLSFPFNIVSCFIFWSLGSMFSLLLLIRV